MSCSDAKGVIKKVRKDRNGIGFFLYDGKPIKGVKILAIGEMDEGPFVEPKLGPWIQEDYPLSEPLILYLHPKAPPLAKKFCEFAVSEEGAKIAAKHGLITPWHQKQAEGLARLKEMKAGKGVRIAAIGVKAGQGLMKGLAVEYVRAKEVVQLSYAPVDSDVAAIGAFVTGGKGSRELLLLADKPSDRAMQTHGGKWNNLGPDGTGPVEYVIAGRAAAIIVNPANKLESLTFGQIQAIFSGKVDDWATIGGTGLSAPAGRATTPLPGGRGSSGAIKINLFGLRASDPATAVFEKECLARDKWKRVTIKNDTAEAIAAVSMDPQAIAFVDLTAIPATGQTVKVLGIRLGQGEKAKVYMPTAENIKNAMYLLSNRIFLYVHPRASDTAKDFTKFIATCGGSEAGPYADTVKAVMDTYQKHGLMPLADAALERMVRDAMAEAAAKAKAEAAKPRGK